MTYPTEQCQECGAMVYVNDLAGTRRNGERWPCGRLSVSKKEPDWVMEVEDLRNALARFVDRDYHRTFPKMHGAASSLKSDVEMLLENYGQQLLAEQKERWETCQGVAIARDDFIG